MRLLMACGMRLVEQRTVTPRQWMREAALASDEHASFRHREEPVG
ncbi:MAG: hypothetical protein JWO86_9000 [Myxococcaceae bacterium]|nr:hypothetical protein [Myxococcaceae bacterium]